MVECKEGSYIILSILYVPNLALSNLSSIHMLI